MRPLRGSAFGLGQPDDFVAGASPHGSRTPARGGYARRLMGAARFRGELGVTQVEVADRLHIAQPTYAAFERSDNLRIGTLQKIVSALGGILKLQIEIGGKDYPLQFSNA